MATVPPTDRAPPTLAFEGRDVSVVRAEGERRTVLSGVYFNVPEAGHLVVVGRSGSGKTTLLRLLNRFEDPSAGTLSFKGRELTGYDPLVLRRRVALVAQVPVVVEGTVRDNLRIRPRHLPEPPDDVLAALLDDVGLDADFLARDADRLSGGERQRVCLARALVSNPEALLLDEPTSALDPRARDVVADLILELESKRRLAVVVATHQAELVRRLGGPALLLEDGRARTDVDARDLAAYFQGD